MWEERFRQAVRMQLLALVLALALTWYALNPAPGPMRGDTRETEPPDENRREAKTAGGEKVYTARSGTGVRVWSVNPSSHAEEVDQLEWPEVIDIR